MSGTARMVQAVRVVVRPRGLQKGKRRTRVAIVSLLRRLGLLLELSLSFGVCMEV